MLMVMASVAWADIHLMEAEIEALKRERRNQQDGAALEQA